MSEYYFPDESELEGVRSTAPVDASSLRKHLIASGIITPATERDTRGELVAASMPVFTIKPSGAERA